MRRRKSILPRLPIKLRKYLLFLLLIISLVYISYWAVANNLFIIKAVDINLTVANCLTEDQAKERTSLLGKNILFSKDAIETNKLKEEFLCIKSVSVVTHLPDRAVVNIDGRVPVANVFANFISSPSAQATASAIFTADLSSSESFLTDIEGVLFIKDFRQDLPRVYFANQKFRLGYKIDNSIIEPLLQIIAGLKELGISVSQLSIEGDAVSLQSKPLLIFSIKRDIKTQVASLQLILEKAKIGFKDLELVDVRFERPIIRYAPVKK